MSKVRVIEVDVGMADGVVLDYLVAMVEGLEVTIIDKPEYGVGKQVYVARHPGSPELVAFRPSSLCADWAPLIDKHQINVQYGITKTDRLTAYKNGNSSSESWGFDLPLAICRAVVKSKLGDYAHIPSSLAICQEAP